MIRSEKQLKATLLNIKKFEQTLADLEARKDKMAPARYRLEKSGLVSMLGALKEEVNEYQSLASENCTSLVSKFEIKDLPNMLIKARLVSKKSQVELGKLINVNAQQIQRYEASGYDGVGFERLLEILYALQMEVMCDGRLLNNEIFNPGPDYDEEAIASTEKELESKSLFEITL